MDTLLPRNVSDIVAANADRLPHRPRNCVWELTLACNLRCVHCGSRAGKPRDHELDTAECLDVVDQLASLGCELITLSGGEPMLRPDWDLIARYIADRGIYVNMVTNATFLDSDHARRAKDAGMCNVGVSLDGPEEVHDRIRGRGTFRRTIAGIEALNAVGMKVGVMTTVNRANFDRLEEVRDLAKAIGAASLRFQLGKPMGSLHDREDLVIRPRQVLDLIPRIARMKAEGGLDVNVGDSIGYFGPHDKALRGRGWRGGRAETWQGCQAGLQAIGVESDGGIKGCLSMQAKEDSGFDPFREGSVREHALAELWFRPGAFAYNREFRVEDLSGYCRRCSKAEVCRGGARCVSAAATGCLSEDPFCYHRIAALDSDTGLAKWIARSAAAASAAILLTASGCEVAKTGTEVYTPDAVTEGVTGDVPINDQATPKDPGAPKEVIDCANVCCLCEYGIIPQEVYLACCAADVIQPVDVAADVPQPKDPGPIPDALDLPPDAIDCSQVCCMCEYGIIPPEVWEACCSQPEPVPDAIDVPPEVIDCSQVCCMCDYGIIPPELWEACCAQPEPTPDAIDVPPEVIDCSQVCCMCEYGIIPPELWEACCATPEPTPDAIDVPPEVIDCSQVCCMCDYGIIPPEVYAACCEQPEPSADVPADVPPEAISCESVCCMCDYGIIPEAVWKECCAICEKACCECDYGEPPPPQCCPGK